MAAKKELLYLVLQFLKEEGEGLSDAVHALERSSGLFFDAGYFEELVAAGKWEPAEHYLLGFTGWEANGSSLKMFFELRKQKYLEALDMRDHAAAVKILKTDLRIFQTLNSEIFAELTSLLALDDFRQNEKLAVYGNTANARALMLQELHNLIEHNPALRSKMEFPPIPPSALASVFAQLTSTPQQPAFDPMAGLAHAAAGLAQGGVRRTLGRPGQHPEAAATAAPPAAAGHGPPAGLPHAGRKRALERLPGELPPLKRGPAPDPVIRHVTNELPSRMARVLQLPSPATSCDFHPTLSSLLLVGTVSGHAQLWEVGTRQRLLELPCDSPMLVNAAITRIVWSPDGGVFGVAFHACKGRGVIHLYRWSPAEGQLQGPRAEIDAHEGGVNDLALAKLESQLIAISGGSDAKVKVWSVASKELLYCFAGHEGPVYSVCPHMKGNISFVFSTGRDGRIKAWLYDSAVAAVVDYSAEGIWWTHMAYSADGGRLFSCGVGGPGVDSTLVEWNESDGAISRQYAGFRNSGQALARFDTVANRYLVVGDEGRIKVWHMDRPGEMLLLATEGEVPPSAVVRVNRPASLLALSTNGPALHILADPAGFELLAQPLPPLLAKPRAQRSSGGLADKLKEAAGEQPGSARGADSEQTTSAPDAPQTQDAVQGALSKQQSGLLALPPSSVAELPLAGAHSGEEPLVSLVTSAGGELVLAGTALGRHHVWRKSDGGQWAFKGTHGAPAGRPPSSVALHTALALSNSASFLLASAGGHVTLYNLDTAKEVATFQQKPPAATALAFDPIDNNLIAVGLDDATIAVFNVREDVVQWASRKTHKSAITGLVYVDGGKALATAGSDAQLCFWAPGTEEPNSYEVEARVRLRGANGTSPPAADAPPTRLAVCPSRSDAVLAVHPSQLAVYARARAACLASWTPSRAFAGRQLAAATASPEGLIFAAFDGGVPEVAVLTASTLTLIARIAAPGLEAALAPGGSFTGAAVPAKPAPGSGQQLVLCTSTGTVVAVDLDLRQLPSREAAMAAVDAMEAEPPAADGTAATDGAAAVPLSDAGPAVAAAQVDTASHATT